MAFLHSAIGHARHVESVSEAAVVEFKVLVTSVLTRHAAAILLDPEYGLSAAQLPSKARRFAQPWRKQLQAEMAG